MIPASARRLLSFWCVLLLLSVSLAAPAAADPVRRGEWWLAKLGVQRAWSVTRGAGVKVALIDTGVDATHPDLRGAITDGTDTSGHGSPDGRKPIGDPVTEEPQHGTGMAALIAGRGHGSGAADGLIGIAPAAEVLTISSNTGNASAAEAMRDVRWAAEHGAKVINMSFAGGVWKAAVAYAEQHDMVVVASAGNDGVPGAEQPGIFFGVVAVSGVDSSLRFDPSSNYGGPSNGAGTADGGGAAVSAPFSTGANHSPGLPAATLVRDGSYTTSFGTSNSAAIVSGVVALIRAKFPDLDAANVINRLIRTADQPVKSSAFSVRYGFGVVDAYKAVTASVPRICENPLGSAATGDVGIWQSLIDHTPYQPVCTGQPSQSSSSPAPPSTTGSSAPTAGSSSAAAAGTSSSANSTAIIVAILVALLAVGGLIVVLLRRRSPRGPPPGWG